MTIKALAHYDDDKIEQLLLGRRIVKVEFPEGDGYGARFDKPEKLRWSDPITGKMTLDDGTVILVAPNEGGCACSAGDYYLSSLEKVDNIITSVRLAEEGETNKWGEGPTSYRIYVVADNVEINAVQIDGDDGNGYYGTGYTLYVIPAEESSDR